MDRPRILAIASWPLILAMGAGIAAAAEGRDYLREVRPLLARRCVACHGALKQQAGLRLDTATAIVKGGESGPALVAGKSSESLLIEAVRGLDGWKMPPKGEGEPLTASEVEVLKSWIDQGAEAPAEVVPADPGQHWAFRPPGRPAVPPACTDIDRNPIDAYLADGWARHRLTPRPLASKETLIRRVSLDLVGLIPTPEELLAFVEDRSDDAYERLVDRLLASPQYGERWGRHWMDVWRYSDWDGFGQEVRESQPHIWHWRDWIVESLNRDDGYDRMVVAMLAADEATPTDRDALRATGYLARNWYKFNRNVWLDSTIEHTAKAFLGVTMNCARCHDHKYDPITQEDYYRFRAVFEPHAVRTDRLPGQPDPARGGLPRVFDSEPKAPTFLFRRGDEKAPAKERPLEPGLPPALGAYPSPVPPVPLPPDAYYPALQAFVRDEMRAQADALVTARRAEAAKPDRGGVAARALAAAEAGRKALALKIAADDARYARPPRPDAERLAIAAGRADRRRTLAAAEEALARAELALEDARHAVGKSTDTTRAALAEALKKRKEAEVARDAALAAIPGDAAAYPPIGATHPATSTGRRLALAHWIASSQNPLAARVAINHIWMRHFGAPLVPTVFDFGRNGQPPSHPGLLDWLAIELREGGWSMKRIHRLIVTSRAYRLESQGAGPADPNRRIDPQNRFLWRMNPRRMEAEAVRDNLLRASGMLDPALGGHDLDPESGQSSRRRSLYFRHSKEKRVAFLKLFDSANATACYRRSESVVPQQALAMANSPIALSQARVLTASLSAEVGAAPSPTSNARFVTSAFRRVLGRSPAPEERTLCEAYLVDQAARLADRKGLTTFTTGPAAAVKPAASPAQRAREDLVHVLFNHHDFVTIR